MDLTNALRLLLLAILFGKGRTEVSNEDTDVSLWQNRGSHEIYVDRTFPKRDVNRYVLNLLSVLEINKNGPTFSIRDAKDGSIIVHESWTLTGWQIQSPVTPSKHLNSTDIMKSNMNHRKSKPVIQKPVNVYIITNETIFEDFKDSFENGEVFILSSNAHDPDRQIYNLLYPEQYLSVIKDIVRKQPIHIYPLRASSSFFWNITLDRDTIYSMVIDFEGVQQLSRGHDYIFLINGSRAAQLFLCTDSEMKECLEGNENSFNEPLRNISSTFYLKTNTSNYNLDYYEDNSKFPDSSPVVLGVMKVPRESQSSTLNWGDIILCVFVILVILFIAVVIVIVWIRKRKTGTYRVHDIESAQLNLNQKMNESNNESSVKLIVETKV